MTMQLSLFTAGNSTANYTKADPALLERKEALAAGGPPGWRPNRLFLLNYWHFTYEEFHFVQGRLVLRGSNGSGKSTVLAAAITLTLDGEKRRERMDTFGGQGRSVAYYLVGPPGASPDSEFWFHDRTAYVAIEFEHGETRRYATVGVGLYTSRSRPNLDVDFWGFTIEDGRRLGTDLLLFDETSEGRIPLTERQLKERLGAGGQVTNRQGQYQKLVNDLLFGMPDEEYDDLLKVLVHLRSPKLNKDIKPSDVCEILARSLPPLEEDLLGRVTRIIEDIDNQQDLLERTRKNLAQVADLDEKLEKYLNQLAQQAALAYRDAHTKLEGARQRADQLRTKLRQSRQELEQVLGKLERLAEEQQTVQGRLSALEQSPAFADEKALENAERDCKRAEGALQAARQSVAESSRSLERIAGQLAQLEREWQGELQTLQARVSELERQAGTVSWPHAEETLNTAATRLASLRLEEPGQDPAPPLQALVQRGQERLRALGAVVAAGQELHHAQTRYDAVRAAVEQAEAARDDASDRLARAEEAVDEARQSVVDELHRWQAGALELQPPQAELAHLASTVQEYPQNGVDLGLAIDRTFRDHLRRRQGLLDQAREPLLRQRAALSQEQERLNAELRTWEKRSEAEPPRREGQDRARRLLADRSVRAVPLYAACDVRTGVPSEQIYLLEQALDEAGLLDALVVDPGQAETVGQLLSEHHLGDRWIRPAPIPSGETLADYLEPVDCGLPPEAVRAVLSTVAVGGSVEWQASATLDGRWQVGPVAGSITPAEAQEPIYIGAENRRRRRQAMIDSLRQAIAAAADQIRALDEQLQALDDRRAALDDELEALRTLPAWEPLHRAATQWRQAGEWLKRCQSIVAAEVEKQKEAYSRLTAAKERWQQALTAVPECRGLTASGVQDLRTRTERLLDNVRHFADLLARLRGLRQQRAAMEDARQAEEARLQSARARQQAEADAHAELKARADAILERLVSMGIDQIRQEIGRLRRRSDELSSENLRLSELKGALERDVQHDQRRVEEAEEQVREAEAEQLVAHQELIARLRVYPTFTNQLEAAEGGAEGALETADNLLKLRRTNADGLGKAIAESIQEAWRFLSSAFNEYKSDLVDYRPELDGELVVFRDLGARLLPCELRRRLESEFKHQQQIVREKENELYTDFILRQVAGHIRDLVGRVEDWRDRVNKLLGERKLSNGEVLSINWRPKPPDRVTGADMGRVVQLLQQDVDKMHPEQVEELIAHFRGRVDEVRQRERRGEQEQSFADALAEVLDYRLWFEFTLHSKLPNQDKQHMTDIKFTARSGAEKSLAMFIPLLAAAHARYSTARQGAPRLVGLDEAFAGVDEQNTREMFRFLVELEFSWIMTSEKLWGVAETLPGCATYELVRHGAVVTPIFYLWDGTVRLGSLDGAMREVATADEP